MSAPDAQPPAIGNENDLTSWPYREQLKRAQRTVMHLYWKARFLGWLRRITSILMGSDRRLLILDPLNASVSVSSWRYVGIQNVLIDQIIGCESPCTEFDGAFYPTPSHDKARWLHVAIARRLSKPDPPIELIHTSRGYFVQTGKYQISVARARGERTIQAYVTSLALRDESVDHRSADKVEFDSQTNISNTSFADSQGPFHYSRLHSAYKHSSSLIRGSSPSNASPPGHRPSTPSGGEAPIFNGSMSDC
jgi:hypothetical protein